MALRVSFVVSSLNRGGAEKVLSIVASGLAARGYEVCIITLQGHAEDDLPVHRDVEMIGLSVAGDTRGVAEKVLRTLHRLRRIRAAIVTSAPNVVVSFGDQVNVLVVLSTIGLSLPIIVSERIHPVGQTASRLWRTLRGLTYPLAKCLVVQAKSIGDAFTGIGRLRRVVIGNPVPVAAFAQVPRCRSKTLAHEVVAIGRLAHQKGFDTLIDAFAKVLECEPASRLVIYGDGPERDALSTRVDALDLKASVTLMGPTKEVTRVLASADVFVLPSRFEGMPNAMLEAMACATPVIAADCPGAVSELAGSGEYAYLVETDNAQALAEALKLFLRDHKLRDGYGCRAREGARRYLEPVVLDQWQQLVEQVAAVPGRLG